MAIFKDIWDYLDFIFFLPPSFEVPSFEAETKINYLTFRDIFPQRNLLSLSPLVILTDLNKEEHIMRFTEKDKKEAQWLKSEGFNWIARDREGSFSVTINKPIKNEKEGYWVDNEETDMIFIPSDSFLFAELSYEDDGPVKLEDIIEYNMNSKRR